VSRLPIPNPLTDAIAPATTATAPVIHSKGSNAVTSA
jgi:hypothetical protein